MEETPLKKEKIIPTAFPILISILLFSFLLGFLYRYDNKYTYDCLQPVSGTLVLSEENLAENGVYYLTKGWQLYPDVLLSPDDFAGDHLPSSYMQTVTIGKHSSFAFDSPSRSTSGCATYHLTLMLPEKTASYMLILPEIYSCYRLYVNGEEIASVGAPEPKHFMEKIRQTDVVFTAGGKTELLIAVSNRSHFSGGMTYPPVFGLPNEVSHVEATRFMLDIITFVLALICTLFSLYLQLAFRGEQNLLIRLFFAVSLCVTITYAYPILFLYAEVSPKLWYGIELAAIYGSYLSAVMLQNEICGMEPVLRNVSTGLLAVFCAFTLVFGLLPYYPLWLIKLFGISTVCVKLTTAAYLSYCAIHSFLSDRQNSRILLVCTTAFAVSIVFDRLFPGWEPIMGGWPAEYGFAAMILGISLILWRTLSEGYRFKLTFEDEKRQLTRQIAIQKAHYQELNDKIEEAVRLRHDERHHLQTLYNIYETKDYSRLEQYLSDYVLSSMPKERTLLCRNLIVDGMLRYYETLCSQTDITFFCEATLPPSLTITDVELSILFGNLLENAYEAAGHVGCEKPFITIRATVTDAALFLLIENSCAVSPQKDGGRFLSTKHEGYGMGTRSVSSIVEEHGGQCVFRYNNGIFSVHLQFPLTA